MFSINKSNNTYGYTSQSNLIRYLTTNEQFGILSEIRSIHTWYTDWSKLTISDIDFHIKHIKNDLSLSYDLLNEFPITKSLVESFSEGKNIGRVSYTQIPFFSKIGPFTWETIRLVVNQNIYKRYICFLNFSEAFGGVILDSQPVFTTSDLNNAIYELALTKTIFFNNTQSTSAYYLMFDIMNA